MICKKCGYQNSQGAAYCNGCGKRLDGIGGMHSGLIHNRRTSKMRFVVTLIALIVETICFYFVVVNAIIPLHMQGLIMISANNKVLRPTIKEIILLVGSIIHATKDADGIWRTTYGAVINPSCSMSSLELGIIECVACCYFVIAYFIRLVRTAVQQRQTVFHQRDVT